MNVRRSISGAVGVLTSVWTIYIVLTFINKPSVCPVDGCTPIANDWVFDSLLAVAILLLVSSGVSVSGRWIGLPLSVLLSLLAISFVALQWNNLGSTDSVADIVLAIATVASNIWALMAKPVISEENHPLNLPVFG
jgi:hypothetical protein